MTGDHPAPPDPVEAWSAAVIAQAEYDTCVAWAREQLASAQVELDAGGAP